MNIPSFDIHNHARIKEPPRTANTDEMQSTTRPPTLKAGTTAELFVVLVVADDATPVPVLPGLLVAVREPSVVADPVAVEVFGPPPPSKILVFVSVTVALLATPLTLGIAVAVAWNSTMLLVVELKFV